MASRKPNLHVSTPEAEDAAAGSQQPQGSKLTPCSPRSPRFREEFDAPFSEAMMNASRTTFTTDVSGSFPSTQSCISLDGDCKRQTSASADSKTHVKSSEPQGRWTPSSESTKRSTVNDRIREWARKSLSFARRDSEQSDDSSSYHAESRTSKVGHRQSTLK